LIPILLEQPEASVINLNVPAQPLERLPEYRAAALAPFAIVQPTVPEDADRNFRRSITELSTEPEPHADAHLPPPGYATVTALTSVSEDASSLIYRDLPATQQ